MDNGSATNQGRDGDDEDRGVENDRRVKALAKQEAIVRCTFLMMPSQGLECLVEAAGKFASMNQRDIERRSPAAEKLEGFRKSSPGFQAPKKCASGAGSLAAASGNP